MLPPAEPRAIKTALRVAVLALAIAAAVWAWARQSDAPAAGRVGLFTSLPIVWNEEADLAGLLRPDATPHWARAVLAKRGELVPLDRLAGEQASEPLAGLDRLVIAQPRALAPDENVALDTWVRGGGRVLLLADPAMTEPSAFAFGDPRRPQDLVMLSPILGRWGLELTFDEDAPGGETAAEVMGLPVPVDRPGRFRLMGTNCRLWGEGVAASCGVGKGRVIVLADAAVLGRDDPDGGRARALDHLLDSAFAGR